MKRTSILSSAVLVLAAAPLLREADQAQAAAAPAQGLPHMPAAVRNALASQNREAAPATPSAPLQTREEPMSSEGSAEAAPAAASSATPTAVQSATGTVEQGADGGLNVNVVLELRSMAERLGVALAAEQAMTARGATVDQVRAAILTAAAGAQRTAAPIAGGSARVIVDERDTFRQRAMNGLILRAQPTLARNRSEQDLAAAREFRGLSFERLAEECLRASNQPTRGLSRGELIRSALSTSDFPNLLGGALSRTLRELYEFQPAVYREVAQRRSVADFRTQTSIGLSGLGEMRRVPEGGEPKRKDMAELPESYALEKFEEIIPITFEALVNDDLGAFQSVAPLMAAMALATERRAFFSLFTPTGPTMSDGVALFNTAHRNLITASPGAPSVARLGAVRQALRMQTDAPQGVAGGNRINMPFAFVLSPTTHETTLDQLFAGTITGLQADGASIARNDLLLGNLKSVVPIIDPMLDDNSTANWFGLPPSAYGAFIYAYLQGEDGLVTEELPSGRVSGIEIKARLAFAAACLDWRGVVQHTG